MVQTTTLKDLLDDTGGCAAVPTLAKEGIISLLISIVANGAILKMPGASYDNLLRFLVMFLVILGIIHYLLVIIERLRRKKAKLEDIQAENTRKVLKDLHSARSNLERLIQTSDEVTDLRNLRNRLTTIIFEVQNPNLEKFKRDGSTIEEFNTAERSLIESAEKLSLELQSKDGVDAIDIKTISCLVDEIEESVHNRVPITGELKDLYLESIKKEKQDRTKIPGEVSRDLSLYLNSLQTKYASNKPEVMHTGDYLPDARWEYDADDKSVTARLLDGFGTPLVMETRWQDYNGSAALVELVQKEAMAIKKNQYKCLCLVNTAWDKESKDYASRFKFPKLALYLYELNNGLYYNKENTASNHYEFWFNTEQKNNTLKERALGFIGIHEYFTVQDAAGALGLNERGAQKLLFELEKKGSVTDVSFKSDKVRRYTKARAEG